MRSIYSLILVLSITVASNAQELSWTKAGGTLGGNVEAIAFESECGIYVATVDSGLHKSEDCGETWRYLGFRRINGAAANINGVMVDSQGTVFIAINSHGVHRSVDGGETWTGWNSGLPLDQYDCLEPGINDVPTICTRGFGVLQLIDGNSWTNLPTDNLNGADVRGIGKNDSLLVIGTFGQRGDVYGYSFDFETEYVLGNGMASKTVRNVAVDNDLVLAATFGEGVRAVFLDDLNWTGITEDLPTARFHSVHAKDNMLYAGSDGFGVYSKSREDQQWTPSNDSGVSIFTLAHSPEGKIYAGGNNGLYQILDDGSTKLLGPVGGLVRSLAEFKGALFAGFFDGGIYHSNSDAFSWSRSLDKPQSVFALHNHNDQFLLAGTFEEGVYRLRARDSDWEYLGLPFRQIHDFVVRQNGDIVASTKSGVHRLESGSDSWKSIGLNPLILRNLHLTDDDQLFALSASNNEGQIFLYDDAQERWTAQLDLALDSPIWKSEISEENKIIFSYPPKGMGIFDTATGELRTMTDPSHEIFDLALVNDSTWIAAAWSGEIYKSSDSGNIWESIGVGPEGVLIRSIHLDDRGRIILGSETAGVWLSQEGIVEVSSSFDISSIHSFSWTVYPNPTADKLSIQINEVIEELSHISLRSNLGRTIFLKYLDDSPSRGRIELDLSDIASGSYILSLHSSDGATSSQKMIFKN